MSIEETLEALFLVKREIKELKYQEQYLKELIIGIMDDKDVDNISLPRYSAVRSVRYRESILKKNVPEDIWNVYAERTPFYVLNVKPQ